MLLNRQRTSLETAFRPAISSIPSEPEFREVLLPDASDALPRLPDESDGCRLPTARDVLLLLAFDASELRPPRMLTPGLLLLREFTEPPAETVALRLPPVGGLRADERSPAAAVL